MKTRVCYKVLAVFLVITILFQVVQPISLYADQEIVAEQEYTATMLPETDGEEEPMPSILSEVEEKRTADTKHFLLSDGSFYAVQYQEPVHYQDENGVWQQYDNSVVEENDELKNKKSDKDIRLSNKSKTNNMVKMTVDDYAISWGYEDVNGVKGEAVSNQQTYEGNDAYLNLINIQQEIIYQDAFLDADLQYFIQPSGIKENIILKTPQAQNTYTIQYRIDKLTAYQIDAQTIYLKDDDGNIVYILSAPYMTDATGETSNAVTLTLISQKNKKLEVVLTADKDWLQAEERAYPVLLDPYVKTEQDWNANEGAFISSANPDNKYGYGGSDHQGTFYVGRGNAYGMTRTLIKSGELPELSKGDMVVAATISLVQRYNDATMQINAHEITKDWDSTTVCWNSNITYDSTVLDYITSTSGDGKEVISFNITGLAKEWYNNYNTSINNSDSNYGVMLISATESESRNQQMRFFSTSSYEIPEAKYPWFTIVYRNNKGLESYWTYTQVSAGTAGTAYINDYTGNLVFVTNGVSTGGNLMPASLYTIYNGYMAGTTEDDTTPTMGKGFRLNIQQTLKETTLHDFPYVYTDGDGTEHYFYAKTENGTTTYWDEDGLGLELILNSSSTSEKYKLKDDKDNFIVFHSNGLLNYIQDSNGNKMTVNYSSTNTSLITGVTDGAGKTLQIQGDTSTYNLRDAAGRATYFDLNSDGYMVKAHYSTGTTTYTYDSDGALSSVTDNDGYKIEFYYTSLETGKMVEKVKEYGTDGSDGQEITFDRTKYNTTIVRSTGVDGDYGNADDIITTYQFDNFGRTISVESHTEEQDMGAASYNYTAGQPNDSGNNIKQLNRVSKAHSLGINTVNLLKNSGAEQSGNWTAATWVQSATFTSGFTTAQRYLGQKSFEIAVSEHVEYGRARYYQDLNNTILKPGHTYTLSAYVKTSNIANNSGTYGACIAAVIFHDDGTFTDLLSEYVYGTTDTAINNGWRRLSITFTVPANTSQTRINLAVRNCTGTAWFDAVQVEEADAPNAYNLVENSSFEIYSNGMPTNWTGCSALTISSGNDYTVSMDKHHGSYAFQMKGVATSNKYIYQSISVSGTEKDIYILSGWAKANAVPDPGDDTRKFKISIEVKYSDGTSIWKTPVTFNHDVIDWQFASVAFDLSDGTDTKKTPTAIVIYPRYTNQQNTAYFDQIQLIKDVAQSYTYDADGNLITVVENAEQDASMQYDDKGNLTQYIDAMDGIYTYDYDDSHNLETATSQRGVKTTYDYTTTGLANMLTIYASDNAVALRTTASYTEGYLTRVNDADGNAINYVYDTSKGTLTSVTDSTGTTNYTYNSSTDQLTGVQKTNTVNGTTQTSSINYTYTYGRLTKLQSPTTQYNFTYDVYGNTLQTLIGTRSLVQYTYDENNGVLLRADFGNSNYVTYTYDQVGNVTAVSYNGIKKYEWKIDSAGRTTTYIDNVNQQQTNYEYDSTGRLIRTSTIDLSQSTNNDRSLYATEYTYDLNNNVTKVVNITKTGTYTTRTEYIQDNLPKKFTMQSGRTVVYDYDSLNRLTGKTLGTNTPVITNYQYKYSNWNNPGQNFWTTNLIQTETIGNIVYTYTYDAAGNLTSILETQNGTTTQTVSYVYDQLNQLVRENDSYQNKTITYTYDNNGNLRTVITYPYTTGTLGTPTSTNTYSYENEEWGDLLTAYNGQTLTYDAIGNPLTWRDGMTMTWQAGRRLASLQTNGKNIQYTYDADGLRVTKTVDGTKHTYQYVGGLLMYETRGDISFSYDYDSYGHLSCIHYMWANGSSWKFYVACNSRGDVTAIYAADGTLRAKYTYDSWGNTLSIIDRYGNNIVALGDESIAADNIGALNRIRYRGYYYDNESGLYYLQSRYYDPQVKRFLNADVFLFSNQGVLGNNLFIYCGNNPVVRIDTTGYSWTEFWEGVWDWMVDIYERNMAIQQKQQALDTQVRLEQINGAKKGLEYVGDFAENLWDVYMRGFELQQRAQLLNSMALIEGVEHLVENPEEAIDLAIAMGGVSSLTYKITIGAITSTPVTGIGVATALAAWGLYRGIKSIMEKISSQGG